MKDLTEIILSDIINQKIFKFAEESSINIYLVGGYLREILTGIEKADRDYVIEGHGARNLAENLAGVLRGSFVDLDKERDIARVVIEGRTLDFSGTLGKSIEEDLLRRDFTINSIAWSPKKGFIDPMNGMIDIKKGVIRAIKKENMSEDPIRLLRVYRFSAQLKMDIEPRTVKMITELSHLLQNVSGERISSEVFKILESPQSFIYLYKASQSGILESIFPELVATRNIPPHVGHYLGTIDHSLEMVRQIELLLSKLPDWVIKYLKEELSYVVSRLSVLKLAGLLHDIGKPLTWTMTLDGEHRFVGYERIGAELIDSISERLKLSNKVTEILKTLIKCHLIPLNLIESGTPEKKDLYRVFKSLGKDCIDITILAMSICHSMSETKEVILNKERLLLELLENFRTLDIYEKEVPKLLTGKDIIEIFNIRIGPEVGRLIKALREAQILGEVRSKEEAIEYIRKLTL